MGIDDDDDDDDDDGDDDDDDDDDDNPESCPFTRNHSHQHFVAVILTSLYELITNIDRQ